MILVKVDKRKARRGIIYTVVDENTNELLDEGKCEEFSYVSDKYYDLKDMYGSNNVRMVLK